MTGTTVLPAAVSRYFDIIDAGSRASAIELFADNAAVTDDGSTYRGRAEVLGWLTGAASQWEYTTTILSARIGTGEVDVQTRIDGNFPGGQARLRNVFTLDDDGRIAALSISA